MTNRQLLIDAAIEVLRQNEVSVIINYKVDGNLTALRSTEALYDTELNGQHFTHTGVRFDIPRGEFRYSFPNNYTKRKRGGLHESRYYARY